MDGILPMRTNLFVSGQRRKKNKSPDKKLIVTNADITITLFSWYISILEGIVCAASVEYS